MKTLLHAAAITFAFYLLMGMSSQPGRSTSQAPLRIREESALQTPLLPLNAALDTIISKKQ